jgi:multidrug efflux pump subunit AcrA (membrane-fusion protein)
MEKLVQALKVFKEDVLGEDNAFFTYAWLTCVVLILAIGFYFNSESVSFLAIADSREQSVNFDYPVIVKRVHVIPGQAVSKGQILVELRQPEIDTQVRSLRSNLRQLKLEKQLRDQISKGLPEQASKQTIDPQAALIAEAQTELDILENQQKNLFVFADYDGVIGNVFVKAGESAQAFTPILTLASANPSIVQGFIHESVSSNIQIGQKFNIKTTDGRFVVGEVASLGARIVPIPNRLLKISSLMAWGKEVVIRIPEKNSFLLGEKVSVEKDWGLKYRPFASATAKSQELPAGIQLDKIQVPSLLKNRFNSELSAIVYSTDLQKYLLASDEYSSAAPTLYLMNEAGEVQDQKIDLPEEASIDDIESLSTDGEYFYLMSSLSTSKKGNLPASRQKMMRIEIEGLAAKVLGEINLRQLLSTLSKASKVPELQIIHRALQTSKARDFEVEGHFVQNNTLFLAVKSPLLNEKDSIILTLKPFSKLWDKKLNPSALSLQSRLVNFSHPHVVGSSLISDMVLIGSQVYLSTSTNGGAGSALWKLNLFDLESNVGLNARFISHSPDRKVEGLAFEPLRRRLIGVFDNLESPEFFSMGIVDSEQPGQR